MCTDFQCYYRQFPNGDEIPDRNVDVVYDDLFDVAEDEVTGRMTTDRSATRIDIQIDGDAEQAVAAAQDVANQI